MKLKGNTPITTPNTIFLLNRNRLSLSHNQIWHLPYRFAECSQLRYLNVRANVFREFPKAVHDFPTDHSLRRLRFDRSINFLFLRYSTSPETKSAEFLMRSKP